MEAEKHIGLGLTMHSKLCEFCLEYCQGLLVVPSVNRFLPIPLLQNYQFHPVNITLFLVGMFPSYYSVLVLEKLNSFNCYFNPVFATFPIFQPVLVLLWLST